MNNVNSNSNEGLGKSLLLHNPDNMEYGYISEPTILTNIRLFRKDGRIGILADVNPYIRDNLNRNGKFYKRIIITPTGIWKKQKFIDLQIFPIKVQVILINDESLDIPENWFENKYFKGTITEAPAHVRL